MLPGSQQYAVNGYRDDPKGLINHSSSGTIEA